MNKSDDIWLLSSTRYRVQIHKIFVWWTNFPVSKALTKTKTHHFTIENCDEIFAVLGTHFKLLFLKHPSNGRKKGKENAFIEHQCHNKPQQYLYGGTVGYPVLILAVIGMERYPVLVLAGEQGWEGVVPGYDITLPLPPMDRQTDAYTFPSYYEAERQKFS